MTDPGYREDWRDDAACKGMDPEFFYPERGEHLAQIKAVCHACPVRRDCLEWALDMGEKYGIWGGLSERARRLLRRDRRIADGTFGKWNVRKPRPPCGTDQGYAAHGRWMEPACDECKAAHALTRGERRERRLRAAEAS